MRNIYYQFIHSLKCVFLDYKPLLTKILAFSLVILVLGSAFSDMFDSKLEPVTVGILNADSGSTAAALIEGMQTQDGLSDWMKTQTVENEEEGRSLACDSDIPEERQTVAMIHFGEDFSQKLADYERTEGAEPVSISVKAGRSSMIDSTIVKCVFDAFTGTLNADAAVQENFPGETFPRDLNLEDGYVKIEADAKSTPDAMSYYAIAMLMMVLLYGAEYGCSSIADDYFGVIGDRIKITPIKRYQQYIGKMLGMVVATALQGLFIVLLSGLVYGANWGNNYLALLVNIFSMSAASVTLGACLCMITRDGAKGQSMVSLLVIACTFLAGGFVKIDMGPLKFISPNYYAQTAMFNSIYNGDTGIAMQNIGILWLFVIGASAIAIVLSRRKRA